MDASELLMEWLEHNTHAIHPSRGKQNAALIRKTCEELGVDEDKFLPRFVRRDKKSWGLEVK